MICNLSPGLDTLEFINLFLNLDLLHAVSLNESLLLARSCHQRIVLVHHLIKRLCKYVWFGIWLTEVIHWVVWLVLKLIIRYCFVQGLWYIIRSVSQSWIPHSKRMFLRCFLTECAIYGPTKYSWFFKLIGFWVCNFCWLKRYIWSSLVISLLTKLAGGYPSRSKAADSVLHEAWDIIIWCFVYLKFSSFRKMCAYRSSDFRSIFNLRFQNVFIQILFV